MLTLASISLSMVTTCSTQIIYSIIFLSNVALLHSTTLASTYRAGDVGIEQQNHQIFGNENQLFECHMHKHIIFCPPARQKIIHYNLCISKGESAFILWVERGRRVGENGAYGWKVGSFVEISSIIFDANLWDRENK